MGADPHTRDKSITIKVMSQNMLSHAGPAVISWLFRVTGAPHLATRPFLLRALWYGMRCLMTSDSGVPMRGLGG